MFKVERRSVDYFDTYCVVVDTGMPDVCLSVLDLAARHLSYITLKSHTPSFLIIQSQSNY